MKGILLILGLLVSMASMAQYDRSGMLPGVVKVNDYLYADVYEVSNLAWLEYLNWLSQTYGSDADEYRAALPDSNSVKRLSSEKNYLRNPAYRDYPVAGISWEQARNFCEWRTLEVKKNLSEAGKLDRAPLHFMYRLPRYEEFVLMYADFATLPVIVGDEGKKKYRGMFRYNLRKGNAPGTSAAGKANDNGDVTAPVKSYWPNSHGLYNLRGNVAEWLMEPYMYTGGSWYDLYTDDVTQAVRSEEAAAYIGFRCVCEVAEEAP